MVEIALSGCTPCNNLQLTREARRQRVPVAAVGAVRGGGDSTGAQEEHERRLLSRIQILHQRAVAKALGVAIGHVPCREGCGCGHAICRVI